MSRNKAILVGLALALQGAPSHDSLAASMNNPIGKDTKAAAAAAAMVLDFEYYNTGLKHFFRTADAAEAAAIDAGAAGPGWVRTGINFVAYAPGNGPGNDVCRFYNPVANTHFFTADAAECAQVKLDPGWRYEGLSFRIQVPTAGVCPAGTQSIYRNYNMRFAQNDSNHRFTFSQKVYNSMIAEGWAGEGIVMCAASGAGLLSDFSPAISTTLGGAVNFASVNIPAGVTVTVTADLMLTATGPVTIAGTLTGDCKAIHVMTSAVLTISGGIDNNCTKEPDGDFPELTLVGVAGYHITGGHGLSTSGAVLISNDATLPFDEALDPLNPAAAAKGLREVQVNYDCSVEQVSFTFGNAKNGKDGGPTGTNGADAKPKKVGCNGDLLIDGSTITGQSGGNGGKAIDIETGAATAKAGNGGAGGDLSVLVTNGGLDFGSTPSTLAGGNGGNGGKASATTMPVAGSAGAPATATAGYGGIGGTIRGRADDGISIAGTLTLNVGNGGNGGDAIAVAADGSNCTATDGPKDGGPASAKGGDGGISPDKQLHTKGNVVVSGSLPVTGGQGGRGGLADATGGKGGDGCAAHKDAANGGKVKADAGKGGNALVKDLAGALVGAGGASGDAYFRRGLGGNGANGCKAPDPRGGNGGKGGDTEGGTHFPGTGRTNGTNGIVHEIVVANGGNGGCGVPIGKGGAPGSDGIVAVGVAPFAAPLVSVTPPVFTPGKDGTGCYFSTKLTVVSDVAPAHEGFVNYTSVNLIAAITSADGKSITFVNPTPTSGKWITVSGSYDAATGHFTATGTGTAAGYTGVPVTFTGTFDKATGQLTGQVTLSGSPSTPPGGLPGHPVSYTVTGTIQG